MGHLSRNLTLAEVFSTNNFECRFLIQSDDKDKVVSFLESRNKNTYQTIFINEGLNTDKDIRKISQHYDNGRSFLIMDHYSHDFHYEKELRRVGIRWAQFDYKKEDQIIANIVINPNVGVKESDYDGLIGSQTKLCVGERFAIISEVFKKTKVKPQSDRILIAMGGGNYPQEVIDMISVLVSDMNYRFDLLTTQDLLNKKFEGIKNIEIHKIPKNIADIYARNRVAVVAGGVTTYELAYLNIPFIIVPFTDNQQANAAEWKKFKNSLTFKGASDFTQYLKNNNLSSVVSELFKNCENDRKIIDGEGAYRIFKKINKLIACKI